MITKQPVIDALQIHMKESVKLKRAMDEANTSTKRKYLQKKLTKNNLTASKLLATLEKLESNGNKDAATTNADGNSQEES